MTIPSPVFFAFAGRPLGGSGVRAHLQQVRHHRGVAAHRGVVQRREAIAGREEGAARHPLAPAEHPPQLILPRADQPKKLFINAPPLPANEK